MCARAGGHVLRARPEPLNPKPCEPLPVGVDRVRLRRAGFPRCVGVQREHRRVEHRACHYVVRGMRRSRPRRRALEGRFGTCIRIYTYVCDFIKHTYIYIFRYICFFGEMGMGVHVAAPPPMRTCERLRAPTMRPSPSRARVGVRRPVYIANAHVVYNVYTYLYVYRCKVRVCKWVRACVPANACDRVRALTMR